MSPSATPATQNDRGCAIVPRLPREIKGDVTKCHACHAEVARRHGRHGRLKPRPSAPPSTISATPATQNDGGCEFVPRLPRDIKVDVTKCHACHAKRPVKFVCVKFVCVKLLYVKFVYVKLLYVKFVRVKFVCVNLCMLSLCVLSLCV